MTAAATSRRDLRLALWLALSTFCIWGLSPLFYKQLAGVPADQVLAHRAIWSLLFMLGFCAATGRMARLRATLADAGNRWGLLASGTMIAVNWFIFIWAVGHAHGTEASLGYYLFPLVATGLGVLFLRERLNRAQILGLVLAGGGVLMLSLLQGSVPLIALGLASSFGFYGLIRKRLEVGPIVGVTGETALLAPFGVLYLLWCGNTGAETTTELVFLVGAGLITAVPLVLFAEASRRLPYSTLGVLQYINPSLQFLCAVLIFGEPFGTAHLLAFPLIWLAVGIYCVDLLKRSANNASA